MARLDLYEKLTYKGKRYRDDPAFRAKVKEENKQAYERRHPIKRKPAMSKEERRKRLTEQENFRLRNDPEYRAERNAKHRERSKKEVIKNRAIVLAYYGNSCSCCGESLERFLSIDHINNDGATHRKTIRTNIYKWLIRHKFPPGFQLLCMNCNFGKAQNGGFCPHQEANNAQKALPLQADEERVEGKEDV
jgi:hypothetical protein